MKIKYWLFIILSTLVMTMLISCEKEDKDTQPTEESGTFTDNRDGNTYKWVKIGDQIWMAENLKYKPDSGLCWVYNDLQSNVEIYGYLYGWYSALESCPDGWHIPSETEWQQLIDYLGGRSVAGGEMKKNDSIYWLAGNVGTTNSSNFSAIPGGELGCNNGFYYQGQRACFWTSNSCNFTNSDYSWARELDKDSISVIYIGSPTNFGYSVRCIKD